MLVDGHEDVVPGSRIAVDVVFEQDDATALAGSTGIEGGEGVAGRDHPPGGAGPDSFIGGGRGIESSVQKRSGTGGVAVVRGWVVRAAQRPAVIANGLVAPTETGLYPGVDGWQEAGDWVQTRRRAYGIRRPLVSSHRRCLPIP